MQDYNVLFKENMFVYAAESATNPSRLKVTIPEVFLDKSTGSSSSKNLNKGNINIFVNQNPPAIKNTVTDANYITLPVIGSFHGSVYADGINKSISAGIGSIKVGDRLVASFIGNSPENGIIIARC